MVDREEQVTEQVRTDGDRVTTTRAVSENSADRSVAKLAQIVWFIFGAIIALLTVRIVLSLLGANPANAFANFIYTLSEPLAAPFRGLLQVGEVQLGVARFELETLVAILVYALIGWGIVKLINLGRRDAPVV